MRIGYDDADSLLTYPHVNNLSTHGQPIRMHGCAITICSEGWRRAPFCCTARPRTMRRTPGPAPTRLSRHAPLASRAPRAAAPGPYHPRAHSAHTKRARTNRSGRATYSAQALGRLPWFAPFLRRSRRLRPRFDMSFSLGLLSRLKHFCTHWPKPPRHRPFAATKVTEKRAATPASSARAARRDHALSQRS